MKITVPATSNPATGRAATPMAFIAAIVMAYRKHGIDPAKVLALGGVLKRDLQNPDARVTAAQMEIISSVAMQELDDEALGWFSRRLPWGSYGMLCRASLTAPDLGVAMKRWCRHHRLLTDDIALQLSVTKSRARLEIVIHRELGAMQEFCLVTSLRYVLGYVCWAVDSRIPLLSASFPFDPPAHREVYPLLFPCELRFNAERAGISFDAEYLALPVRRDEAALQQMLQRAVQLTVLQYRRDRLLVQRTREFLRKQLPKSATAEAVAVALNVSMRTLYRQLESEGASLQQIKNEVRCSHATQLLTRTRQPVKAIAGVVGFRNEKSFIRAFKLWTGKPPAAFRAGD